MKIEKLENGYKLTDLYITASLLCETDIELITVDKFDKKQTMFVIKGDPVRIKSLIDAFFNGKHRVDANLYGTKIRMLKSQLYSNY